MPEVPTLVEQGFAGAASRLEAAIPMVAPLLDAPGGARVPGQGGGGKQRCAARADDARDHGNPDPIVGRLQALRMWREDGPVWIREVQALNLPIDCRGRRGRRGRRYSGAQPALRIMSAERPHQCDLPLGEHPAGPEAEDIHAGVL
jgi:hypothetical protein